MTSACAHAVEKTACGILVGALPSRIKHLFPYVFQSPPAEGLFAMSLFIPAE